IIGFSTQILISGIVLAGSLIDTQTAMGVASAFDPAVGVATTLFSKLLRYIIIIIFLIFDGHHMLLSAIYQSFKLLPLASPVHLDNAALVLVQLGTDIFRIGVLLAAPCLLVLFLLDFAFGIVTRVAPDINIFALAMQFKPLANLFVFLAILPIMVRNLFTILERVAEYILKIFLALQM
ncbi:flagellar biosynthetic protein FliR, partial [bacterium]|nr:flagellar biosynthetic protein FliR [bacterium]